ncbi:MAG: chemotaxis protein CheV [bacterium]
MNQEGILLESGTNEVEILEFLLRGQSFGVNVAKIQAIVQYDESQVTKIPQSHHALIGMLDFRSVIIPLIDLTEEFEIQGCENNRIDENMQERRVVLVLEFNNEVSAVLADGVNRIHRISWEGIKPLSPVLSRHSSAFTGSTTIDNREILLFDLEKVLADILPHNKLTPNMADVTEDSLDISRASKRVLLAEDSNFIRESLTQYLQAHGYTGVMAYRDGKAALNAIKKIKQEAEAEGESIAQRLDIVVTDIEMPKMDGLTLCKNIKEILGGKHLPVVMFSSLINEQMAAKCPSVGADIWISKPQFAQLVKIIDDLSLKSS